MSDERPIATPLPAASILLVRDGERSLEVLMMERAKTMRFAPGAFVFPGGKIDTSDGDVDVWADLTNGDAGAEDAAFRIGVLRELYEEAAVLLTVEANSLDPDLEFSAALTAEGACLNVADIVPFAHWVTPEPLPRRFDTHFYIAAHNGQEAKHDGVEAVSLRWVCPKVLLADWDNDRVPLMFPTRLNLMKLARAETVAEALKQARESVVVRTLPVVAQGSKGVKLTIDAASGYGVTTATSKELKVETPK
ncbi:MAG: hypothetical protein COB37_01130 [Kordiimonadales bacterium]|nr:MAG: hypothetical protein COB37_01130 [Kordiimonadales bacterium]